MANKETELIACRVIGKAAFHVGSRLRLSPAQASARVHCLINGSSEGEYLATGNAEFKNGETFSVDSEAAVAGVKAGFLQEIGLQPKDEVKPAPTRKKRKRATPVVVPPETEGAV